MTTEPEPAPVPPARDETAIKELLAAGRLLGYALSARVILLLALIGAFALGVMAMREPSTLRLWTVIAYAVLTIIPATYLEAARRRT